LANQTILGESLVTNLINPQDLGGESPKLPKKVIKKKERM